MSIQLNNNQNIKDAFQLVVDWTGKRTDLVTTEKWTLVGAINENANKLSALGTTEFEVNDIASRDALTWLTVWDLVLVNDASDDATVNSGWAIYRTKTDLTFFKIAEWEWIDLVVDLSITKDWVKNTIANSKGWTTIDITWATTTTAWLLTADDKTNLDNVLTELSSNNDYQSIITNWL